MSLPGQSGAPRLSIVIPVFNEAPNLAPLTDEIRRALEPLGLRWELLYVDDGSNDGTPATLLRLAEEDKRIRVLELARNAGQSAAFEAGFRFARGDWIVTLDADLQNDPADIPALLRELERWDVVCGIRQKRQDSWVRRAASRVANGVRNRLTSESIADVGCSLRAYRAVYLRRIPLFTGMHRFLPTLLRMEGARIVEVPVSHRPRRYGESKYNIRNRLFPALADLMAVRWMMKRWIDRRLVREVTQPSDPPDGSRRGEAPSPASGDMRTGEG